MANKKSGDKTSIQFILFFTVGAFNFLLRQIVFTLFSSFGLNTMLCNFIAFSVSVVSSYLVNGHIIFKKKENEERVWWKVFFKLYFVYAITGVLISGLLLWFFLDVVRLSRFTETWVEALNLTGIIPTIEVDLLAKGNSTPVYEWIAEPIASVITVLLLTPVNFAVNKFWAYKS